jgi:hypothetical protein
MRKVRGKGRRVEFLVVHRRYGYLLFTGPGLTGRNGQGHVGPEDCKREACYSRKELAPAKGPLRRPIDGCGPNRSGDPNRFFEVNRTLPLSLQRLGP